MVISYISWSYQKEYIDYLCYAYKSNVKMYNYLNIFKVKYCMHVHQTSLRYELSLLLRYKLRRGG